MRYLFIPIAYLMLGTNSMPTNISVNISLAETYQAPADKLPDYKEFVATMDNWKVINKELDSLIDVEKQIKNRR